MAAGLQHGCFPQISNFRSGGICNIQRNFEPILLLLRCTGYPCYAPRGWPILVSACIGYGDSGSGSLTDGRGYHWLEQPSGVGDSRRHEQFLCHPQYAGQRISLPAALRTDRTPSPARRMEILQDTFRGMEVSMEIQGVLPTDKTVVDNFAKMGGVMQLYAVPRFRIEFSVPKEVE